MSRPWPVRMPDGSRPSDIDSSIKNETRIQNLLTEAARKHLQRAVELDGTYADAIYNLGALDYDAGALEPARHWWLRYLELDAETEWAKRARAGIAVIDRQLRKFVG